MKREIIDWESDEDIIYCPATQEIILEESGPSLSKACLFYYSDPDVDIQFKDEGLKQKYNAYLDVLDPDLFIDESARELTAVKLLLKELDSEYKNLLLYSVLFTVSTATDEYASFNFCIDMAGNAS